MRSERPFHFEKEINLHTPILVLCILLRHQNEAFVLGLLRAHRLIQLLNQTTHAGKDS